MKWELAEAIIERLKIAGVESPQLEARWILEAKPDAKNLTDVEEWISRRTHGEPLAYILGTKGFYKFDFFVQAGVLIPRPETELIVEWGLECLKDHVGPSIIYDFGFGSGCIGLSLLKELSAARLIGIDVSNIAIDVATQNANRLGVGDRARFIHGNVKGFDFPGLPLADLIVANPPYIAVGDSRVQKSVFDFEPHEALFSGATGLEEIGSWSKTAYSQLKTKGLFLMEVGVGQRPFVDKILAEFGFEGILWHRDLAGVDRVVSARKEK